VLIWVADIAAFIVGKKWGTIQLAPDISPGKTVQGMYAALGSAVVCALTLSLIMGFKNPMRCSRLYLTINTYCFNVNLWRLIF
jgi:phosphatidate cytidylyltransferase